MSQKEIYYIEKFNTFKGKGYNCSIGGGRSDGENNGMAKITAQEVFEIREAYKKHKRRKQVYPQYSNKLTFGSFARIWDGSIWKTIHMDVYTEENKKYYMYMATLGAQSFTAKFTNEEIIAMRTRYITETARQIYQDYKDRCSYNTLQQILWGRVYTSLPIYKKQTKEWINL